MKTATNIVIMRGIETNLVKSPKIKKSEQRTSARTAKTRDVLLPIPKKLINHDFLPEKLH